MKLTALAKDKETKEYKLMENDYPSKSAFIRDIRANGYSISPTKVWTEKEFEARMQES